VLPRRQKIFNPNLSGKYFWPLSSSDPSILKIEKHIFKFQKIININLDKVNDITCKYAKFNCGILYIVGYTTITKSDKFVDFRIYIL
jgi:hypothetical protein